MQMLGLVFQQISASRLGERVGFGFSPDRLADIQNLAHFLETVAERLRAVVLASAGTFVGVVRDVN